MRRKAGAIAEVEAKGRAVGPLRQEHVALRGPALDAALGAHLEPVGAAEQHLHTLIAGHRVEHREAAPGPGVQLQVRLAHEHLEVVARLRERRGEEADKQGAREEEATPARAQVALNWPEPRTGR